MAIAEDEYLKQRLDDQIDWYDGKSATNQVSYKWLRSGEIVAAALIPLLASYAGQNMGPVDIGAIVGARGVIVTILAGMLSLFRFQENWSEYRAAADSGKQEGYLFLARAEPYQGNERFELLVQRVEARLKSETAGWAQAMRASGAADRAGREDASG